MCFDLQDLAALPDKDRTPLAEGGLNLSGGQKARVALARYRYKILRHEYNVVLSGIGTENKAKVLQ